MKHTRRFSSMLLTATLLGGLSLQAGEKPASPAALAPRPYPERLQKWADARFGLFMHWGVYSVLGRGEWVQWNEQIPVEEYAKLADQFVPDKFDANVWARTAKAAGMKYTVLTSRHHDGFALFDDPGSDFTSVKGAAHRDFVADYVKAVRDSGLLVGLYYSPLDWRFPGYILPDIQMKSAEAMRAQYHRQMRELLSNYGPIDLIWFDGGGKDWLSFGGQFNGAAWQKRPKSAPYKGRFDWKDDEVYAEIRRLQPQTIINNRIDAPEDFHSREGDKALGDYDDQVPWELCTTLAGAWGWQPNAKVKPLSTCIQLLVGAAGRDGNLLLNVGPKPDGEIEPEQVERLNQIGEWLAKNGESIYGTRGGPWKPTERISSTRKGNTVYVHVLNSDPGPVELPALSRGIRSASMLGGGEIITEAAHGKTIIHLPEKRDPLVPVIKLELDGSAMEIPAMDPAVQESARSTPIHPPSGQARVKQLQDLRWGLFVCWSFSTFSGREWTPGVTDIGLFRAKDCDTDQWAKAAKDAGMGYVLFLAKHHDGFCLWDTLTTDRKVTRAPLGRDVLAELKKSCDKYGIKLAIYFSEGEWAWPGGKPGEGWQGGHVGKNPAMKKAQLEELLTRYGPIEYIWFDHAVGDGGLSHAETAEWVRKFQPDCFVGFNSGSQAGADIRLGEEGHPAPLSDPTGAGFNGKHMVDANNHLIAEFTYPILPEHKGGAKWFYSLPEHDGLCLPAEKLYADFLGAVKYGNIFSLDVGPDYDGKLRAVDVETLHKVGEMIRNHAPIPAAYRLDSGK